MRIDHEEIVELERIYRLNLINSITGIKPANLIGTRSAAGVANVAIFSSVVHLGSDPALLGFIARPAGFMPRDTVENILETGEYTINHVTPAIAERAHFTSARFPKDVSEFERCGLTEENVEGFSAPFVAESSIKIGMKIEEEIPIERNGTSLIIGSIRLLIIPDGAEANEGQLDLESTASVGISGLDSYYKMTKIGQFPYAAVKQVPDFDGSLL